jgi:cell wall-associated NlpC family hydrolase
MKFWADKYVGKPYAVNGSGPDSFDCWGLVRYVLASEFGVLLPEYKYDSAAVDPVLSNHHELVHQHLGDYRSLGGPQDGAIVLLRADGDRPHVGVCVGVSDVLHVMLNVGTVLVPLTSPWVRNGISGYYLPNTG